ncbi:EXS-domain-containing protein [Punctularia strigosozonata HHB-11173 SS5]|uniref:EXS-domain-containing protein n=1 Tax=Punctularia strigosozonata (strain HHB-11173) TaxID=741275 RepID=UPI00044162E4|nr:EXS-domain-containing protein [Punctularia strigosozonata HHB-11173 SS5]EIN11759.1 EXS-domain-containing protein [Punctularia strigosozonata HHB-11173 SS5]
MNNDVDLRLGKETPLAASFPLPFRALSLIGIGILGWATNLHVTHLLGIDAASILDLALGGAGGLRTPLPTDRTHVHSRVHDRYATGTYKAPYRLFVSYATWCTATWLLFRVATRGEIESVDRFKYIPAVACLGVIGVLVSPFNVLYKRERDAFLLAIRRCIFPQPNRMTHFCDVVLADIFTSYAKVIGDVWLSVCMLLPGGSLLRMPSMDGLEWLILPTLMSLPYVIRFRQCMIDYMCPINESRRPLYNAIKYATAFPLIFLSAAQRIVVSELVAEKGDVAMREPWHGEHQLFRLWLLSAAVNSLYSFWWDLTNDWGLDLLKPKSSLHERRISLPRSLLLPTLHSGRASGSLDSTLSGEKPSLAQAHTNGHVPSYPWGLRRTLLYPLPVYPLVVFFNLILRMTWSMKLSSHLHSSSEGSVVIFWIEVAEIFRRWMWVFLRIEWEVIKKSEGLASRGAESPRTAVDFEAEDYELVDGREAVEARDAHS